MTLDGQAGEGVLDPTGGPSPAPAGSAQDALPVGVVLDLCDRQLREIGRRQHRFAWLRPPGGGIEDCLVCDAYYPGNRLVVICREDGEEPDALFAEEVPRHGLLLLVIAPPELGPDPLGARDGLVAQIGALGPRPERPRGPMPIERPGPAPSPPGPSPPARGTPARSTPARSARAPNPPGRGAARRSTARRPAIPESEQRFGMLVGLALVIVLAAESLILVVLVGLGQGHPVLAFGFALDAGARALGTIAAGREGDHGQAWSCILLGSPGVLYYVSLGPDGEIATEPGPLAGIVSVLAIVAIAVAVVGALIGI